MFFLNETGELARHSTTSRLYKQHVAEHFCGLSGDMTVLELGVYQGHTTVVLASIFQKVIAVDLKKRFLTSAAKTLGGRSNVVFLEMDLLVDSWSLFAINQVDVVVIDANHDYEYVRADAENALRYLPDLKFLVFHDAWLEEVQRAVTELETAGMMTCQNIGLGADGHPYSKRSWDPKTQRSYDHQSTLPEGKLCRKTETATVAPSFAEKRYLIYEHPMTTMNMCPGAFLRPYSNGTLKAGIWSSGNWSTGDESGRDQIMAMLPTVSELPMETGSTEHVLGVGFQWIDMDIYGYIWIRGKST
eukprot:Skav214658  [mRNA]  locus=scaffold1706:49479:50384:+ [translate_table: standard]